MRGAVSSSAYALAALLLGAAASYAAEPLSLSTAIESALDGPLVAVCEAHVEAAAAQIGLARAARTPQVEVEAGARVLREDPGYVIPRGALGNPIPLALVAGERGSERVAAGVQQLLLDFGRTGGALRAATAGAEAARLDLEARRREVARATVRAFAAALAAQQRVVVLEGAVATAAETERVVAAMAREELLARSDLLAAQYRHADLRAQLAGAQGGAAAAMANLTALTGITPAALDPVAVPAPSAEVLVEAGRGRPELLAVAARRRAAEGLALSARAERFPVLALGAGAEKVWDKYLLHENNAYAGFALRASVFDGGSAAARTAEARATARALLAGEEALRRQVDAEVTAAVACERGARDQLAASERGAAAAAEALRLEKLRHADGLTTTRELLQAESDDTAARAAVEANRAAAIAAVAERLFATGSDIAGAFAGNQAEHLPPPEER